MTRSILAMATAITLVAAALVLPSSAAPTVAATSSNVGPCIAGWQELTVPDGSFRAVPFEVVTHKGKLAWVLGATDEGILSLRWNGSRLKRNPTGPGGRRGLIGGVAVGHDSVLGVGMLRPRSRQLDELIGRVGGSTWYNQKVPLRYGTDAALTDVVKLPSGNSWAVGASLKNGKSRAIALFHGSHGWRNKAPLGSSRDSGLLGLTRSPNGVLWTVGWRDSSAGIPRPLVMRLTRSGWKVIPSPKLARGTAILTDVGFHTAAQGWAVGYHIKAGSSFHQAFLQRWNGKAWRRIALPWAESVSIIPRALSVAKSGELWITGTQLATTSREARGFIAHGSGKDWTVKVLDTPASVLSDLKTVAATTDGAVVAGNVARSAIVLQTCEVAGPAAKGRKINVSKLKRRRAVTDPHGGDPGPSGVDVASTGRSVSLASRVAPKGFVVRDMAAQAGIAKSTLTYGALAGHFNRDGWKDLLISRHWIGKPILALGGPNGFEIVPREAFSAVDRHGCDAADVNNDGRKDILCVVGRARGTTINRHELALAPAYANGRLARAAKGISDPLGRGRAVAFIKLDGDAYPEVFITNQPEREDSMPAPNRFFRNVRGRFVPAPGVGLDTVSGGFCADGIDVDGDGDQDLLHCQTSPRDGRPAGLRIYRNNGGKLVERSAAMGVKPIGDIDVTMADVTGDGKRDLIQLSVNQLRVSKRTATGFRKIFQTKLSAGEAVAAGDVNGDRRADIYVVRSGRTNKRDLLLVNKGKGGGFTSVIIPQTSKGSGDDVVALDYDHNGLTDFVVLNGRASEPGPIQLLASFRTGS